MVIAELPPRDCVQIDRLGDFWCLTYEDVDVDVRARITHTCDSDPDEFVWEVRVADAEDFVEIGRCFVAPIEHSPAWKEPPDEDEYPGVWRGKCLMLARLWSHLTDFGQMAPATGDMKPFQEL
jgi:hypothetical protein